MRQPIGVIDSGVGGLTVVKELQHRLPNESIVYIGDDKRCPYGPRSPEEVRQFTVEMVEYLADLPIKLLVIACNTATAVALEVVREQFDFPVIGVIEPGARAAIRASQANEIAVLGTVGTVKSEAYNRALEALVPHVKVHSLACPNFVPIVENNAYESDEAYRVTKETLASLHTKQFDAAILGCTHYPLLEEPIRAALPAGVKIISSAVETVSDVEQILQQQKLAAPQEAIPDYTFFTTGEETNFAHIVKQWLTIENPKVRHLIL